MQTIAQALYKNADFLKATDNPLFEAEVLLAHSLKKTRAFLLANPEKVLAKEEIEKFEEYISRRAFGEPIAYLLGHKEFWSLELEVTSDTLIPRPETELLVETAFTLFNEVEINVADLGTGSGAIALALASERTNWRIDATDQSEGALSVAKRNAERLGLNQIAFYQGHWCDALPSKAFDLIISNPPYISEAEWEIYAEGLRFEPKKALISEEKGLKDIREISHSANQYLKPHGYLIVEHGFLQGEEVRALFVAAGYKKVHSVRDLAGFERITIGCYLP